MQLIRRILHFSRFVVRQTRGQAILALLFLILGSIIEGLSIILLIPLLQLIGPATGTLGMPHIPFFSAIAESGIRLQLLPLLVGFVGLVVLQAFFLRFKVLYMTECVQVATDKLRMNLFQSIGWARWSVIAQTRASDLNHALTVESDRVQGAIFSLLQLVQNIVMLLIYAVVAAVVSIKMTLFASFVGGVVLLALFPVRRKAAKHGESLHVSLQERQRTFSEFLSGMKIAKAFNAEPRYFAELSRSLNMVRKDTLDFARLANMGLIAFQVTSTIAAALFIYFAVVKLAMPLSRIAVMLVLFMRVSPRFNAIQTAAEQLISSLPAFDSIQSLIARCARGHDDGARQSSLPLAPLAKAIRFDAVSLRYTDEASSQVLHHVSLTIPAGSVTALIGPSGSGKSTIADLVLGLLEPSEGRIWIDDVVLDARNRRAWRDQIAYVPQDVFLLHDTIGANLTVAQPGTSIEAIWAALDAANAREFVERLPLGLDTVVGDRGVRLSGGERQRIALARGLLRQPRLLILDEATSALDWENQTSIARSIERLRGAMTIITIAHRPSMIAFADWVITVEDGRIVETGDYAQLLAQTDSRLQRLITGEQMGKS
ncbi:ABC transporter ATP-binding protein [soil metagenome]